MEQERIREARAEAFEEAADMAMARAVECFREADDEVGVVLRGLSFELRGRASDARREGEPKGLRTEITRESICGPMSLPDALAAAWDGGLQGE